MPNIKHIYHLGIKELWSLIRDPMLMFVVVFMFTGQIFIAAMAITETLHKVPIAIVDEDASQLSAAIVSAFYPPRFQSPELLSMNEVDPGMDSGTYTFAIVIPPGFERDVRAGRSPALQLNVDATRMTQAFTGNGYIQQILLDEINAFFHRDKGAVPGPNLVIRTLYNPNLESSWFGALNEIINVVTIMSIILTGATLIREREHGTIEHLLVMPVTPTEIMISKVWTMGLVVLCGSFLSLKFVIQGWIGIPIHGSIPLFLCATALCLFATTSLGIFMGTIARSMPQFGMLGILTLVPMLMLSGGVTPLENMPLLIQRIMMLAPSTHFIAAGRGILFRGAGIESVWPQFLAMVLVGAAYFAVALFRFRKSISLMA
ncbi:MAG: ABC transporter permease [Fretibacterium sp.]|nr:ABC transporter permease [Fretibacterium sp.]